MLHLTFIKFGVVSTLLHITSSVSHALSWSGPVLHCKVPWLATYIALPLLMVTSLIPISLEAAAGVFALSLLIVLTSF